MLNRNLLNGVVSEILKGKTRNNMITIFQYSFGKVKSAMSQSNHEALDFNLIY